MYSVLDMWKAWFTLFIVLAVVYWPMPYAAAELRQTIVVNSEPPQASIWLKSGRTMHYLGKTTPATIDLSFSAENDAKSLVLRRLGYNDEHVVVSPRKHHLSVALTQQELVHIDQSIPVASKRAAAGNIEQTIRVVPDPTRGHPYVISKIILGQNAAGLILEIVVQGDSMFFGRADRAVLRERNKDKRLRNIARIFFSRLDEGLLPWVVRIADSLDQVHTVRFIVSAEVKRRAMQETARRRLKTKTTDIGNFVIIKTTYYTQRYSRIVDEDDIIMTVFEAPLDIFSIKKDKDRVLQAIASQGQVLVFEYLDSSPFMLKPTALR